MNTTLLFVSGWLYVNFVEYAWHRWMLHSGNHQVHDAHHRAFFTGEYEGARLLNHWAIVAAALHVVALCLISLKLAAVAALSLSSYLVLLEVMHRWQHGHPDSAVARWHIQHHRHPLAHFNIFLPVWDYLLGTRRV